MKKIFFILAILSVFIACGGGGRDEPTPPPPPDTTVKATTLLTPTDKELCATSPVNFTWQAVQYATSYKLTISKVENGTETPVITLSNLTTTSYSAASLEKGKLYKWKVETTGPKNTAVSVIRQFQTESVAATNHAPFAPELVSPTDGGTLTAAAQWNCSDPDNDALTYEVLMGTSTTNLQVKASGITAKTYTFTGLTSGTTYYWRVTATDTKGNKTIGQIWSFKAP